ncbi:hypothetical protein ACIO3O_37620 [Streptomyces sp. NPDC087440]|uniref:hypothetical protein n=1 Tax=Streptomyces sp. NPDC087440 TaxID=3365790 RepID=UPI0037FF3715
MPRKRPGRVRTKNTNRREALKLSSMAPEDYNVRPDEVKSIACPDCRTWRRIMGDTVLKIREHCVSGKVAEGDKHALCPGSDQLVIVDIDVRRWQARQDRLLREAMPQDNRRAAQQFYKPLPVPAAPVSRIRAEATLNSTRQHYLAHRKACTTCTRYAMCPTGEVLVRRLALAFHQEPARREEERVAAQVAYRQERARLAFRGAQWDQVDAAAEVANNQCRKRSAGAVSEFRGPDVPLKTLRPAHRTR